jgi:hypothetical protein
MTTSPTKSCHPRLPVLRAGLAITILAAAGCDGDDEKTLGPVTVTAVDSQFHPLYGEVVVFADTDGESRLAITDADGKASGEIEAGGTVWKVRNTGDANMGGTYTAIEDVQPGDSVSFGPPPRIARPIVATMTVVATPPADGYAVRAANRCGTSFGGPALEFDDRCGSTADALLIGYYSRTATVAYYKLLPDQPVADGGTISAPEGPWNQLDTTTITFANLGDRTVSDVAVINQFGVASQHVSVGPTPDVATGTLPVVGDELLVSATVRSGTRNQRIALWVPAQTAVTIDVDDLLVPFVTQPTTAPFAWTGDDGGAAVSADVKIVTYDWTTRVQNVDAAVRVITISDDVSPGEIGLPQLPEGLDQYQPTPEFTVQRRVRLLGFDQATTAEQALDLAEYLGSGSVYAAEALVDAGASQRIAVTE